MFDLLKYLKFIQNLNFFQYNYIFKNLAVIISLVSLLLI